MKAFKNLKNLIIIFSTLFIIITLSLLLLSCQENNRVFPPSSVETFFEAEDAQLENAKIVQPEEGNQIERGLCVGHLQKGSNLSWKFSSEKTEEGVYFKVRLSCPMAWIGVHNLPQSFSFDKVYTLKVNGKEILMNRDLYGSSNVNDSGNYYYWVNATTDIPIIQGENEISLTVSNTGKRVYSSFGNIDYISLISKSKIDNLK